MSEHITASEALALLVATRCPGNWYRVTEPDGDDDNGPNGEDYPTRHVACEGDPVADCDTPEVAAAVAALPRIVAALEHMEERHANAMLAAVSAPRLARILAVERGDWREVPSGWEPRGADMWVCGTRPGRAVIQRWHRDGQLTEWLRRGQIDGPRWPTALEAMEAIDAVVAHG